MVVVTKKREIFKYQVKDDFFPQTFEGEIEAPSKEDAERQLKEEYAYELDTIESSISVIIL